MTELFANNAATTVSTGGGTAPSPGTVETWTVSSSASFPAASAAGGKSFHIADPAFPAEKILVTNIAGTTWTVTRGAESTTPISHLGGFTVIQVTTAGFLSLLPQGIVQLLPSGDTSGVTDTAAITTALAVLGSAGGEIRLSAGSFYWTCGSISVTTVGVYIRGAGMNATYVNAVGTGDMLRMSFSGTYSALTTAGGSIADMTIDGTSAGAGSSGFHVGDIFDLQIRNVFIRNFTGTGSIGAHVDNANYWTERLYMRVNVVNCTQCIVFDVSGATTSTNSYARCNLDLYVAPSNPTYDGLVLNNGAALVSGHIRLAGNFNGSASVLTSAAVRITGTVPAGHPGAGLASVITSCHLAWGLEAASGFAHAPQTIVFGAAGNAINGCEGFIDFAPGGVNFAPSNNNGSQFHFEGPVNGDTTLKPWSLSVPFIQAVADLGTSGVALVNGTPTLASWTAPSDGKAHPVFIPATLQVSSAATGGAIGYTFTDPGGTLHSNLQILAGSQAAGPHLLGFTTVMIQSGSTFSLVQTSALTAGAAILYGQVWGA